MAASVRGEHGRIVNALMERLILSLESDLSEGGTGNPIDSLLCTAFMHA